MADLVPAEVAYLVVGLHDLLLIHSGDDGVHGSQVDGVLVRHIGPDLSVGIGASLDLVDCGRGDIDECPYLVVDGGIGEAAAEVGIAVGEHDAEHHRRYKGTGSVGGVHLRRCGSSASEGVGDAVEPALGDRVVGIVDPGDEGAVLGGVLVALPDLSDRVGVPGLDGEGRVSGVVGIALGVAGLSRIHCEAEVGDDDEQGHDEHGRQREGLGHLLEASGEARGLDIGHPVPGLGPPEGSDDDGCGTDGEDASDDRSGGVAGPYREEGDEQPNDHEELCGGVVPPEVDVGLVDREADREPHGQPAVVGGDVGHGHMAVRELLHDGVRVHRVPEDEVIECSGHRDGEDRAEDEEGDDQCGDRDHPGLGPERDEGECEHDGDDGDEDRPGVGCIHQARRNVVGRGNQGPDQDCGRVSGRDACEILAPYAGCDGLKDHCDRQEDDREAESVPGEGCERQEHSGDCPVDEDGLLGGLVRIGGLDHLHGEVGHECDEESRQRILIAAGEHGSADRQGHECDEEGCNYTYRLVEHLFADQVHRDAQKSPEDGIQHSQGHGCGLGGSHATLEDGGDAGPEEVHEGRDVEGSSDRIVDRCVRHGPVAIEDAFDYMQMILCTRAPGQGEIPIRGYSVGENEA